MNAAQVREALRDVHDPEIPQISVVDLGVIGDICVSDREIRVELLPTFVGCPAIELMRSAIGERLASFAPRVTINVSFSVPWTSDRITPEGRRALRESGFAPPIPLGPGPQPIPLTSGVTCPFCGSRRTALENVFGPTLCRSIYYCTGCRQPFEQFKTV